MPDARIREFRAGDGVGIARMLRENGASYAKLAPDYFKQPDEAGLVEFIENDSDWRDAPENLCLVAEIAGEVAECHEATIQPAMDIARWQSQRDLSAPRLFDEAHLHTAALEPVGCLHAADERAVVLRKPL